MDFLMSPGIVPCIVLVGSVISGDPSCSPSSPSGNLVDGLPPAANISESKLHMVVSAGEKYRRRG